MSAESEYNAHIICGIGDISEISKLNCISVLNQNIINLSNSQKSLLELYVIHKKM